MKNSSYPSLIRHFYGNLEQPTRGTMTLVATLGDVEIVLDTRSLCRILGVDNDGAIVLDTNS